MLELERIIGTNELICQGQRCMLNLPSLNDILHIRLNDPDVAEVDLRPVVAEFLRTNKPRKEFDVDPVEKQSYHYGFFSEATVKVRKIQTASDAKFEGEVDFINEFYDHDKE